MKRKGWQAAVACGLGALGVVCLSLPVLVSDQDISPVPPSAFRAFSTGLSVLVFAVAAWVFFVHRIAVRRVGAGLVLVGAVFFAGQAVLTAGQDRLEDRRVQRVAPQVDALSARYWQSLIETRPTGPATRDLYDDYLRDYGALQGKTEVFTEADRAFRARWFLYAKAGGVDLTGLEEFLPNTGDCDAARVVFADGVRAEDCP